MRVTWDFSNGTNPEPVTGGGNGQTPELSTTRTWSEPGMHPVTVTVDTATTTNGTTGYGTGTATITTAVSPSFADVSAAADGQQAEAIWSVSAAKLMSPCRAWVPNSTNNSTSSLVGQAEFCPQPLAGRTITSDQTRILRNQVTGELCTLNDRACGVTADTKAVTSDGNPTGACTGSCRTALITAGVINSDGTIAADYRRCQDNVTARTTPGYTGYSSDIAVIRGTDPGCATYNDLLTGLVNAATDTNKAPTSLPSPPTTTTVSNALSNSTFSSAGTGWTTTGTVTFAGNAATTGSGQASITNTTAQTVVPGFQTAASATVTSPGVTATVTTTYYNGATALTPTFSQRQTVAGTVTIPVLSLAPVNATAAKVSVTTNSAATINNLYLSTAPTENANGTLTATYTTNGPVGPGGVIVACGAGPQPDQATATAVAMYGSSVRWCDGDAALTKRQAYTLLVQAAGWTPIDTVDARSIADLANPTLASGVTTTEADLRAVIGTALTHGVPLVGDLHCPTKTTPGSDERICFNPDDALTRGELATLFAGAAGNEAATDQLNTLATPSAGTVAVGNPVTIAVVAWSPKYLSLGPVVFTGSATGAGGNVVCPGTAVTPSEKGIAKAVCTFRPTTGTTGTKVTLTFTASGGGRTSTTAATITLINHPPELAGLSNWSAARTEQSATSWTVTVPYSDKDSHPLGYAGVRSCNPSTTTCATSANTFSQNFLPGTDTPAPRTGLNGSDSNPSTFVDDAATEIGTVSVESTTKSSITLRVTPNTVTPPAPNSWKTNAAPNSRSYVNGPYSFTVQACDQFKACTTRTYTDTISPVNDKPVATVGAYTSENGTPVTFELAGSDPLDTGRAGFTSHITTFDIRTLPPVQEGTIGCKGAGIPACPNGSTYSVLTSPREIPNTGNVMFRWLPVAGTAYTAELGYGVIDDGNPGTASSDTQQVFLNNRLPYAPPVANVTTSPMFGSLKVDATNAADARVSTTFPVTSNQQSALSAWVYGPSGKYRITSENNAGGGTSNGSWVDVPANTWTQLNATRASAASGENRAVFTVESQTGHQVFNVDQLSALRTDNVGPALNLVPDSGVDSGPLTSFSASNDVTLSVDPVVFYSGTGPASSTLLIANASASTVTAPLTTSKFVFTFNPAAAVEDTSYPVAAARFYNPADTLFTGSVGVYDTNSPPGVGTATWRWNSVLNYMPDPEMVNGAAVYTNTGNGSVVANSTDGHAVTVTYPSGSRTFSNSAAVTSKANNGTCTLTSINPAVNANSLSGIHKGGFWVKPLDASVTSATVTMTESGAGTGSASTATPLTAGVWTWVPVTYTVTNSASTVRLSLSAASSQSNGGNCLRVDDASLWRP